MDADFYVLMTDYENSSCDLEKKCAMVRTAFPEFGILLSVNGSPEYYRNVQQFVENYQIELFPLPDLGKLSMYRGKIEEGYVGILDLIHEVRTRQFTGCVYLESDFYPAHKKVADRVKTLFVEGANCICNPKPFGDKIINFLGDSKLVQGWQKWMGMVVPIQSSGFLLGLSQVAVDIIVAELNSIDGETFMRIFPEVTCQHSTDASKYLAELLFTTILNKHKITLGPVWDEGEYDQARGVLPNHEAFMQRLHDPRIYFIHGLRARDYEWFQEDYQRLHEFWNIVPVVLPKPQSVMVETDFPIAFDSPDYVFPWGTRHDNSTNLAFIADVTQHFNRKLKFLDLGCAGGQLAVDFFLQGDFAIGLEGSDYSLQHDRPNWITHHNSVLFTCDVSRPFKIVEADSIPVKFDCITAWEVTEHIHPDRLEIYFRNIWEHLADDGVFIGSVAMFPDDLRGGLQVHQALLSKVDWDEKFNQFFEYITPISDHWVRWSHAGFHHCCKKRVVK